MYTYKRLANQTLKEEKKAKQRTYHHSVVMVSHSTHRLIDWLGVSFIYHSLVEIQRYLGYRNC